METMTMIKPTYTNEEASNLMNKQEDHAFLEVNGTFYHIYDFSLEKMQEAYKEQEGEFGYVLHEGGKMPIGFDLNKICMHSAGVHRQITTLRALNFNIPISILHERERIVGETPPEGTIGPVTYKNTTFISSSFYTHRGSGTSMESVFMDLHVATFTTRSEKAKPKMNNEENQKEKGIGDVISRALQGVLDSLEKQSMSPAERMAENVESFLEFAEKQRKSQAEGKSPEEVAAHNKSLFEQMTGDLTINGTVMENLTFINNTKETYRETERNVFEINYVDGGTTKNLKISLYLPEFMMHTVVLKNTDDVKGMYVTFEDGTREPLLFNQVEAIGNEVTKNRLTAEQIGFELVLHMPRGTMVL